MTTAARLLSSRDTLSARVFLNLLSDAAVSVEGFALPVRTWTFFDGSAVTQCRATGAFEEITQ